jgi:urea transport system permease protein
MSAFITMQTRRAWVVTLLIAVLFMVVVPALNTLAPEGSALYVPDYILQLLGKFLSYALCALAIDLIWGFTGILSLGHGVFFALGGYAMGMHLMRAMAGMGVYKSDLPDFMVFLDWKELPWFWHGFDHFWFAMLMVVLVPGLFAFIFGFFAFRSRIKGVYFSIITQALTYAMMLLFFRNDTGFGGNNGLTDFKTLLGFSLQEPGTKLGLYVITCAAVLLGYLICRYITASKLGRVMTAIRDAESRVMFSGYSPLQYKLFVWTLSAVMCGVAGALYVPQVGIINPSEMAPANSIEMAIWVAVGGRGSLVGALLGTGIVNGAKSWFTVAAPDYWLYFLGALFIATTLFLPKGIIGLGGQIAKLRARFAGNDDEPAMGEEGMGPVSVPSTTSKDGR